MHGLRQSGTLTCYRLRRSCSVVLLPQASKEKFRAGSPTEIVAQDDISTMDARFRKVFPVRP